MVYHPVVGKIKELLAAHGAWFETFEHEPVRTSEEAAKVRTGYVISQGSKALIARVKELAKEPGGSVTKKFVMFVVPGGKRFDSAKIKTLFGLGDIRFASEAEVAEITGGVVPGGVPPFGNLFGLEVFADQHVFDNEKIIFNAGDRSYSIGMLSADYRAIVQPKVGDIAES